MMFLLRIGVKTALEVKPLRQVISSFNFIHTSATCNEWNVYHLCKPRPLHHPFRRKVFFPEKYTIEPLRNDNLAGRDPNTGRVVTARIGGGIKHLFHWVDFKRIGPKVEGEFYYEKVLQIMECGCRSAHIALVGNGDKLRYILASENMKRNDIIKTSQYIPRHPVLPNEGDAFPLGALPIGTKIHNIERYPGQGGEFIRAAGSSAEVIRKVNKRVVVKMPSKLEISYSEECMATVGELSNKEFASIVLGTPWRHRELGRRPHSGLFQKKTGRFGRKIKPPPPVKIIAPSTPPDFYPIRITLPHIDIKFPPGYV